MLMCQVVAVTICLAVYPTSLHAQENPLMAVEQSDARAFEVINNYVSEKYPWSKEDYLIQFKRREGSTVVFWIIHKDDSGPRPEPGFVGGVVGGGGKSFAIELDEVNIRIIRELRFQ